jgi:RNA polymerase sigma factor (sigma-70 family)
MIAARVGGEDRELVAAVRVGDDSAFEELYRRYHHRVAAYVRGMVRDDARAEDLAQDAFFSALRGMRATDAPIAFKPWIFEIARNAAIDHWRRTGRAEEVSVDAQGLLRRSDRSRLAAAPPPETAVIDRERIGHLRGALDELPEVQTRVLVMRELEGMSYREIAERLDLSRSSVETALFRARRRLEAEYTDISEGRRCESMRAVMMRLAEGAGDGRDEERLARHARRCHSCRRRAYELGVKPLGASGRLSRKTAALLPVPFLSSGAGSQAAAVVAAVAIAGAGGAALGGAGVGGGTDAIGGDRQANAMPARAEHRTEATRGPERERPPSPSAGRRIEVRAAPPTDRDHPDHRGRDGRLAAAPQAPRQLPVGGQAPAPQGAEPPAVPVGPDVREAVPEDAPASAPDLPAVLRLPTPEALPPVEVPVEVPVDAGTVVDAVTGALDLSGSG